MAKQNVNVSATKRGVRGGRNYKYKTKQCKKNCKCRAEWPRRLALVMIAMSVLAVAAGTIVVLSCSPKSMAERELQYLAKDYYENYYYDSLSGGVTSVPEMLVGYAEQGLPTVYLRQLLLFDNQRHASSAKYFAGHGYECDTNATRIKYYPFAPYGRTDYRVEYIYSCINE